MPHINTGNEMPGIVSLLFYKPRTGRALSAFAHTILHGPSPLSKGERELIASYVSHLNACSFCHDSHSAAANCHFGDDKNVQAVKKDLNTAPVSEKMKALLRIAAKVQQNGKNVLPEDVAAAKKAGAVDEEIHDTVMVAAAFCMFNRYVDGLATPLPEDPEEEYAASGKRLSKNGYLLPNFIIRKIIMYTQKRKKEKRLASGK